MNAVIDDISILEYFTHVAGMNNVVDDIDKSIHIIVKCKPIIIIIELSLIHIDDIIILK